MPRETVDEAAMINAADEAHRLTTEELFKLLAVLLYEWLDRHGMPFDQRKSYIELMFHKILTDARSG